ncbi:MAG TPA: hypothetical protein VLX29_03560, partial [Nitrospirota bacterium]|nr:hypothetical protein [Nitrospirota bacterium]
FSYNIYDIYLGEKISDRPAEKALLDSFAAFGITDVARSDNAIQDRTNIFVYLYEPIPDEKTSFLEDLLVLISLGTLFIVPSSDVAIHPVEIHLISPQRGYDKQIKVIDTEYAIESTMWLLNIFTPKDDTVRDKHALREKYRARDENDYLAYLGFRRIYDRVIAESLKNYLP